MRKRQQSDLQSFWDGRVERELDREKVDPKKQVHTDLLSREIKRCIGTETGLKVLDAGAGFGRFSIPLAQSGHKVVHLDISSKMLDAARKICKSRGVTNIDFVQGSIDDLSKFGDNSFHLVLCFDSPLSFCCDSYEVALGELIRVSKSTLILCVMNCSGVLTEGVNFDLKYFGRLKTVPEVYNTGTLLVTEDLRRLMPTLMPSWHAFKPDEIKELLQKNGCQVERISAPGALARFVEPELLKQLFKDKGAYQSYLDFEERYDSDVYMPGVGAAAGGLLITARKLFEGGDKTSSA